MGVPGVGVVETERRVCPQHNLGRGRGEGAVSPQYPSIIINTG